MDLEGNFLSAEEVKDFLRKLEIENVDELLEKDKLKFVTDLTRKWLEKIPFTTLKQLSMPLPRTCPTTPREPCDVVMSGVGGLCGYQAMALYQVLRALGFSCYGALGRVMDENDHMSVMVRDLQETGDLFILEVGIGYPSFTPVKLKDAKSGFVESSEEFTHSFLTYKYKRAPADGDQVVYERLHLMTSGNRDALGRPYFKTRDEKWGVMYCVNMAPVSVAQIQQAMGRISLMQEHKFNRMALAFKYPGERAVVLRNTSGLVESETGEIVVSKLENADDIRRFVEKHFPEIPAGVLNDALKYWKSVQ